MQHEPGTDILAAIRTTHAVLHAAVEHIIPDLDPFREMLAGMMQTMEQDQELSGQNAIEHAAAVNVEEDEEGGQEEGGQEDEEEDLIDMADSYVHEDDDTSSLQQPQLALHRPAYDQDTVKMAYPRLYESRLDGGSRRVLLSKLPSAISAVQVLRGISCHGGIVSVAIVDDLNASPSSSYPHDDYQKEEEEEEEKHHMCALMEFVYPDAAAAFVSRHGSLIYKDKQGTEYPARVYHIPTASWAHTALNHHLLDEGATRALYLPKFPVRSIWRLLSSLGVERDVITDVRLGNEQDDNDDDDDDDKDDAVIGVTVEFVSLFSAANAAYRLAGAAGYETLGISYDATGNYMRWVSDSCMDIFASASAAAAPPAPRVVVVEHVDPAFLANEYNCEPYRPASPAAGETGRGQEEEEEEPEDEAVEAKGGQDPIQTWNEAQAELFNIEPDQVPDFMHHYYETFQPTTYCIVGSTIKLKRYSSSWQILSEDWLKLLMANTLHEPEWASAWDAHFAGRGEINLRKWEEYGMLAAHRRAVEAAAGSGGETEN